MTFDLIADLRADWNQICITMPFPKTELYHNAIRDKYLDEAAVELERFNRTAEFFKGVAWEYDEIKRRCYDVNITYNFLDNPNLKRGTGSFFMNSLSTCTNIIWIMSSPRYH